MNFMDMAKSAAASFIGGNGDMGNMMTAVTQLIEKNGGISNIVQKFSASGLGDVAQSWVSTGENLPVSGDQISKVFGNDQIGDIAKSLNLSGTDMSQMFSKFLPQIVDKLTPNGQVSTESLDVNKLLEIGKSFLK